MSTAIPATHRDLHQTDVATLTTIGADGYPQVTELWFLRDDDGPIRLSLNSSRQKTRNLRADPRATFLIPDRANPLRTPEIRARAAIAPAPDYAFAARLGAQYGGADLRRMDRPGQERLVVTPRPVRVNAPNLAG